MFRSASEACVIERCFPRSAPFPPRPPRKVALPCSAGSTVLRHSPTSPERSRPHFGLWPSRTGLAALPRRPGDLPVLVHVVSQRARVLRLRRSSNPLAFNVVAVLPSSTRIESASCSIGFSKLNSPAHWYLYLRFKPHLAMCPARLEARMDSLFSFPVGLFHPLQHAGLSRRTPVCRLDRMDCRRFLAKGKSDYQRIGLRSRVRAINGIRNDRWSFANKCGAA